MTELVLKTSLNSGCVSYSAWRIFAVLGVLIVLNVGTWLWALVWFHDQPALLGVALIIYSLGLRHAVDADHIVAIDNVTRKLVQQAQRPISVGLYFSMGHSTIILVGSAIIACSEGLIETLERLSGVGETLGVVASAMFLFAIAAVNMVVLTTTFRNYRRLRRGGQPFEDLLAVAPENRGFLASILRPLFRLVSKSWHMFPLGLLLGFGVDTATEIAMFGLSAAQAAKGASVVAVLVFAILFCSGMVLVDTADGVVMLHAYEWAFDRPARKVYYNMVVTLFSVVAAVLVGSIEAFDLIAKNFDLRGMFWSGAAVAGESFDILGLVVIGLFLIIWFVAQYVYRHEDKRRDSSRVNVDYRH